MMASKASQGTSRIPLPTRATSSSGPSVEDSKVIISKGDFSTASQRDHLVSENQNGTHKTYKQQDLGVNNQIADFMRGDMTIQTALHEKAQFFENQLKEKTSISATDAVTSRESKVSESVSQIPKFVKPSTLAEHPEQSPNPVMASTTASSQCTEFPFVQAPVAELEELSDLSQSSCSESDFGNGSASSPLGLPASLQLRSAPDVSQGIPSTPCTLAGAADSLSKVQDMIPESSSVGVCDTSFSEPPSSGDSGFVHDGHASDPDLPNKDLHLNTAELILSREGGYTSDETLTSKKGVSSNSLCNNESSIDSPNSSMVTSTSGEKFGLTNVSGDRTMVRTSKSHENYLQAGIAFVNIDIEDNLAYSLDILTYHDSPCTSSDNVTTESAPVSRSLHNSPEKKLDKFSSERQEFVPALAHLEESKKVNNVKSPKPEKFDMGAVTQKNNSGNVCTGSNNVSCYGWDRGDTDDNKSTSDIQLDMQNTISEDSINISVLSDESDSDSVYHQPIKAVDRPSAVRLAKRLFHLEGFRKSDVSRHLSKKNDFSNLVAEEYLKFFDFQEDTLDSALRKFLIRFSLYGETQERERVLAHFSHRFMESNPGSFNSEDACHTLTCAIMLLNSDLHAPNVGRRMTCPEFIENLADLNDGENFPIEVLKAIYQGIKSEPIEWASDQDSPERENHLLAEQAQLSQAQLSQAIGSNPFLEVPDPSKTTEYKRGYVMRKCCLETDRRKTPFGKRGWKMLYAVLRDMIMYQYKDEHQLKKGQFVENAHNAVRIHHALATKATDYTKKQHVFRLQTADWAEYLFQTGDSKELQEWVDSINLVAASLSAPPLPGAVGSRAKFQRQLLPATYTRLNLREQLQSHKTKVHELEQDLHNHKQYAPEKGAKSSVIQDYMDKEVYLEFELKRFKVYMLLLNSKLSQFPEAVGEPSLVETTIGENEEMGAPPSTMLMGAPVSTDLTRIADSDRQLQPHAPSLSDSFERDAAYFVNLETEDTKL